MKDRILEYIRQNGDASFANLMDLLGDEAKGEMCWEIGTNVILWFGMSEEMCTTLLQMKNDKLIEPVGCSPIIYLIDGHFPQAPIAKRPTLKGYKKEHWLPVLFHLGEKARQ